MLAWSLALVAALSHLVLADVKFTSPAAGATLTGGGTITVEWEDSGTSPSISDLLSYQLFLCAGGNDDSNFIQLTALVTQGSFTTGNSAAGTIQANIGGTGTNAYFLKMISVATVGGTVTNYSPRFTLTGMTGVFPANVQTGLSTVTGTDGPDTVNDVNDGTDTAAGGAAEYTVDYTLQTGLTRYAPMQPQPPTKITAQSATPLYPTSSVSIATTWLPTPSIVTTITQSATYSVSSRENTASAAAQPSDDMAKFLARWKD